MMKGCAEATRPHKIKTMVSLNPVMVDGTGMCGGCRVKIGEIVKFACVDARTSRPPGRFRRPDVPLQRYKPTEREADEKLKRTAGCAPFRLRLERYLTMETATGLGRRKRRSA